MRHILKKLKYLLNFRKFHSIGVDHTVDDQTQLPKMVQILAKEGNPKEMGIEYLPTEANENSTDKIMQYFVGIKNMAKKNGIKLVNIEDSVLSDGYHRLHSLISTIVEDNKLGKSRDLQSYLQGDFKYDQLCLELVIEIQKQYDIMKNIDSLDDALIYQRSILMHKRAKSLSLKHIIVGASHAEDINFAKRGRVTFTKHFKESAIDRKRAHSQHKKLFRKLNKIINGHDK